jgi:hypothetical protein
MDIAVIIDATICAALQTDGQILASPIWVTLQ